MGQIRFRIHARDRIAPGGLQRIYIAGLEEIPWSTRADWSDDLLVVQRASSDSGCVYVPWQIDGIGTRLLSTATLIQRDSPYLLEVELARGLLNRVRNRLFVWEMLGLLPSPEPLEQLRSAMREFALAATSQDEVAEAAVAANRSMALAMRAAESLVVDYSQQAIAARRRQAPISTLLGVRLDSELPSVDIRKQLVDACNIVQMPVPWRVVEQNEGRRDWSTSDAQLVWAQRSGLKLAAGPLLRFDSAGMPDWMVLWEDDFDSLARLMLEHVRTVVRRYAGRVHLWHIASRVNTGKLLSLEEEQRLQLVAQALDLVRQIDPRTPTVVSFDQPWAEYLANQNEQLAPLHYADALVRADLGISGFGLEINSGYYPNGSAPRATFELGRLLDQWSIWGLPLMINLTAPSATTDDPQAKSTVQIDVTSEQMPNDRATDAQREWAAEVLPLLLARNTVQVVLWNQLGDHVPHEFPHGGLFDSNEQPKPTLSLVRDLRKSCLL